MRGYLKWLFILYAISILQASILPQYLLPAFRPDLLLVLMVFLALRAPASVGLPAAYGIGLVKDSLGGLYFGLSAFSFLAVYLLLRSLSDRMYVHSGLLFVIAVSASTLVSASVSLLMMVLFSQAPGIYSSVIAALIPQMLVNAFIASLVAASPSFSIPWGSR